MGSPTRTLPSTSNGHSRRSSSPAREAEAGTVLLERGGALLRAGEPVTAGRAAVHRGRNGSREATGDPALLAEAALGYAGPRVAIVDLDVGDDRAAWRRRSEDRHRSCAALPVARPPRCRALLRPPTDHRSETLSCRGGRTRRRSAREAAALDARHVALWRPDRVQERLRTASEMLAAARAARQPQLELQACNWRVLDLFELGDMPACREQIAHHTRLADELRLPSFQWYAPLWAGTEAALAGRFGDAARLAAEARAAGERAGDGNAELFAGMIEELIHCERREYDRTDMAFLLDKVANSPAGPPTSPTSSGTSRPPGTRPRHERTCASGSGASSPSTRTGSPPKPRPPRQSSRSTIRPTRRSSTTASPRSQGDPRHPVEP